MHSQALSQKRARGRKCGSFCFTLAIKLVSIMSWKVGKIDFQTIQDPFGRAFTHFGAFKSRHDLTWVILFYACH